MIRKVALLLCCFLPVLSAADDILMRATADPTDAWVGQRVTLQIDVLGADAWAQITRVGDIELSGAYLVRTENQGTRLQESIDGVSYIGQRYEVSVYPQREGVIDIPTVPVEITLKNWGAAATQSVLERRTPAVKINAAMPPGAGDMIGLVSSPRLSAAQQWSLTSDEAEVGDSLQRTVVLEADDVSAMAFPPIPFDGLPGAGVYPAQPEVQDITNRGALQGRRTETVTYVFEREGRIRIPDIRLAWWNLAREELETIVLPGRELQVMPGPIASAEASGLGIAGRVILRDYWYLLTIVLAVVALLVRPMRALVQRWSGWRRRRRESEGRYFRHALRSARSGDASRTLRDIMRWLDRINDGQRPAELQRFAYRYVGEDARGVIEQLLHAIATDGRLSESAPVIGLLNAMREGWLDARRSRRADMAVLPELNP